MKNDTYSKDIDIASFEEKVHVIADEILYILKDLSKENQKQINSKLIAEKMSNKETVKNALAPVDRSRTKNDIEQLREIANVIIAKLSEIVPSHVTENLSDLRGTLDKKDFPDNSTDWLDSPIGILKKYIDSLSSRNKELEEFMKQTLEHLAAIESPLAGELSSHQQKFMEDRKFEDNLYDYINTMRDECNITSDITVLKTAFLSKIKNINAGFEKKREKDIQRLRETEKILEEMRERMDEVKHEAEEIRKRSLAIEVESYRDSLTDLHNRRAYDEKIAETLTNMERYGTQASLLLCDIDFFKKINDTFGHKTGDLALKQLADLLRERLRENDFISRYGGEEFAIILPHTDLESARIAGQEIRAYIAQSVFSYKNKKIPLTISMGISLFKPGDNATTVFERADKALYFAKNAGRNTVRTENDIVAVPS